MEEASRSTQTARALRELRKKILSGDYAGGTRLFEVSLAQTLQISRTPVREVMSRLSEEGLLERLSNGGFVVRSFTYADAVDAIELRGVLEGTAARLAAERGVSDQGIGRMQELVARLDGCIDAAPDDTDIDVYSKLNSELHALIVELAGSVVIQREIDRATRLPFAAPSAFLSAQAQGTAFSKSLHIAQDQHRSIVSAIIGREGTRAESIAREHARIAQRNLEYVVYENPEIKPAVVGLGMLDPR